MSASAFLEWVRQALAASERARATAETPQGLVKRLCKDRTLFSFVRKELASERLTRLRGLGGAPPALGMAVPARISDDDRPALHRSLDAELGAAVARLDGELRELMLELTIGVSRAPTSLFGRIQAAFGRAPLRIEPDAELARLLSKDLEPSVWLSLLATDEPRLRAALLGAPPSTDEVRRELEGRLMATTEDERCVELSDALTFIGARDSEPALRASLERELPPRARAAVIAAIVSGNHRSTDFLAEPVDRVAVMEGFRLGQNGHAAVEFLDDPAPEVRAAAVRSVDTIAVDSRRADAEDTFQRLLKKGTNAGRLAVLQLVEAWQAEHWGLLIEPILVLAAAESGALGALAHSLVERLCAQPTIDHTNAAMLMRALPTLDPGSRAAVAIGALLTRERLSVTAAPSAFAPFEAALEANPGDEAAWVVLDDALVSSGDARGTLGALHHAGKPTEAFINQHLEVLLGEVPTLLGTELPTFLSRLTWRHGFVDSARVLLPDEWKGPSLEQIVAALMSAPGSRFISTLRLGRPTRWGDGGCEALLAILARAPGVKMIKRLTLGNASAYETWGDASSLWRDFPGLELVHLVGRSGRLGAIEATALRSLTLEGGKLEVDVLRSLATMQAPRLEHLEVSISGREFEDETAELMEQLLARRDLPLRALGLRNGGDLRGLIPLLARSSRLPELSALSLGALGDADVESLRTHAHAFGNLRRLELTECQLSAAAAAEVTAMLPLAVVAPVPHEGA